MIAAKKMVVLVFIGLVFVWLSLFWHGVWVKQGAVRYIRAVYLGSGTLVWRLSWPLNLQHVDHIFWAIQMVYTIIYDTVAKPSLAL